MVVREIKIAHRLDLFIIEHYGVYSEYYISLMFYANPRVDFLNLKVGTKLNCLTRGEIAKVRKVRGYYNLHGGV